MVIERRDRGSRVMVIEGRRRVMVIEGSRVIRYLRNSLSLPVGHAATTM